MGPKVEELRQATATEKDVDKSPGAAAEAPGESAAEAPGTILDESSGSSGQEEAIISDSDRRVVSAHHHLQNGLFWRIMRVIFFIPLKFLSLFGFDPLQTNLHVSGDDKIDKSPLRPASTSPQKRKRDEILEASTDEEDDVAKLLEDNDDYDSEEDKDFKPGDESTCSEEYAEGDTEGELSKLSIEDVTEPRPSALRNLVEVDGENNDKKTQGVKKLGDDSVKITAKCIDEPISKPDVAPATVGVMG